MYKTMKVLLLVDKQQTIVLKRYIQGYRFELARLCQIKGRRVVDNIIHEQSKWYMLKQVKTYRNKQKGLQLGTFRSAVFGANSFSFSENSITLYFGKDFYVGELEVKMGLTRIDYELMMKYRILRMDLIYDGEWYANFLVCEKV